MPKGVPQKLIKAMKVRIVEKEAKIQQIPYGEYQILWGEQQIQRKKVQKKEAQAKVKMLLNNPFSKFKYSSLASSALGDFSKDIEGAKGSDKNSLNKLGKDEKGDTNAESKQGDESKNGANLPSLTKEQIDDAINKKNMAFGGSLEETGKNSKKNTDPHL